MNLESLINKLIAEAAEMQREPRDIQVLIGDRQPGHGLLLAPTCEIKRQTIHGIDSILLLPIEPQPITE